MANIQIHELNSYSGSFSSTDVLPIDNGEDTSKIPVTAIIDASVAVLEPSISELPVLVVDISTAFSSLPLTVSNVNITDDMVVVNSVLGNPSAQTGDWTVTTATGSLTIAGTISGSTTATLYLMESR